MRKAADDNSYLGPSRRKSYNKRRNVNLADAGESDEFSQSSDSGEEKEALVSAKKPMGNRRPSAKKKTEFPHGKTINGYEFRRDDSVVSAHPPNGDCYLCTSPKHVFRDCPHFGKFSILREANLVNWDMPPAVEDAANQQYLDYLQQSKESSSYMSGESTPTEEKSAYPVESQPREEIPRKEDFPAMNRNERRRIAFTKPKAVIPERKENTLSRALRRKQFSTRRNFPSLIPKDGLKTTVLIVPAVKGRSLPEGLGSLGTRALRVLTRLHSPE